MPFFRPTRQELFEQGANEINALVPNGDARLPFGILNVFAVIWAGLTDGLHQVLVYLSRQFFAHLADTEYLELIGIDYAIYRKAAAKAGGYVTVTGTAGSIVPVGTVLRRVDGVRYVATGGITIPPLGVATLQVLAEKVGLIGNSAAATILKPTSPLAGVTSIVVSVGTLAGGTETETDEELRARILYRRRNPPGAGTRSDWSRWALELPGATRVWVTSVPYGYGTVRVMFAMDNNGTIPSAQSLLDMAAHLEQYTPMGSELFVEPTVFLPVNFTIHDLPNGDPAIRQAITNELTDLLYREGGPGQTIPISHITEAISGASGEYDHVLTVPSAPIVVPYNGIAALGTITWV
jgi:uncharacterized phage protein gp47/JayE